MGDVLPAGTLGPFLFLQILFLQRQVRGGPVGLHQMDGHLVRVVQRVIVINHDRSRFESGGGKAGAHEDVPGGGHLRRSNDQAAPTIAFELGRAHFLQQPSVMDDADSVGYPGNLRQNVARHEDRHTLLVSQFQ